jgi:ABC-type amino acid transport substrate-binding protein
VRVFLIGITLILGSLGLSQTTKPLTPPVTPTIQPNNNSKTIETIRARGRLIVALDPQFSPFALRDEKSKIVGFDVDLARAVATKIGVPLEAQTTIFNGLLNAVKVGRADLAGSGLTASSRADVQFSNVFFDNAQIFVVRSGNPSQFSFQNKQALLGKQIGVRANTIGFLAAFRVLVPLGAKIKVYETNQKALTELQVGKIESLILDLPSFEAYRGRRIPIDRIAGTLVQEQYVFALPKNSDMLPFLNQTIFNWKQNGGYYQSLEKWMLDR